MDVIQDPYRFPVLLMDPPIVDIIEEWLRERGITPLEFNVVDISDLSSRHDTILEVFFNTQEEQTLFKLTWGGK